MRQVLISIRLPKSLLKELKVQAKKEGIGYQTLVKKYLTSKSNKSKVK